MLSGLAMFLLVRRLAECDQAALLSAVAFAFYPYRIEHYAKVQLQLAWWLPLILLAVHKLFDDPSSRRAVLLGAAAAAQLYTCVYYGVFAAIVFAAIVVVMMVGLAPKSRARALMMMVVAGLTASVLAAPLVFAYQNAARTVGTREVHEGELGSARVSDYRRAHPENALYGDRSDPGIAERRLFPGYTLPALSLAALAPPFRLVPLAYAAGGAVAFDLSLGVNGYAYRRLYEWFPPLRGVRVPARFGMVVGLTLAVLAGLGVARLGRGRSARTRSAIALAAMLAVIVESRMNRRDLVELPDPAPAVYSWLASQPRGVVCEYPVGNLEGRAAPQDATYMYYSTRHWQPLVNGYSGFNPRSYDDLLEALADFPDGRSITYLRERRVSYLLVHSAFYITGDFAADVATLRARPDLEWLGRFRWKQGATTEVFRLRE